MPLEPKKPIEELLETTAKTRREQFGADPKMPNPMRAQLHHEIERVARGDDSRRSGHWFHILWPRLAFTTVSALILVSIGTLWWWHEHPGSNGGEAMKLAMQKPGEEAPAPEKVFEQGAAAAMPVAPAASAFSFADSNAAASAPAAASKDTNALARFAEAKIAPSTPAATDAFSAGENKTDQSPLAAQSSAQAGAIDLNRPAQSGRMTNFRQQFSKTAGKQAFRSKSQQTANILNDFQVEQIDQEIRLVDRDGSTYSGQLEPLAQNDTRSIYNQKRNENAPSLPGSSGFDQKTQPPPNAEYYFRATGYNTSLKKPLEIEGNYIVPVTAAQKKASKAKTESDARDEQSRITGVAKIDGESPVQIDAVAVP